MPLRSGALPPEVQSAFEAGLFALPAHPTGPGSSAAVQPVWFVPVVLAGFTDQPVTYPGSDFEHALFDTLGTTATGSVFDYYQWVSGQRIRVIGKVVATVTLPHEKAYYGNGSWGLSATSTPNNTAGAIRDAIVAADPQVDWGPFDMDHDGFVDMLWVIHSGLPGEATQARDNLWSITSRLTAWSGTGAYSTNDPIPGVPFSHIRIDRFSILPELSAFRPGQRSEIGVFCHEFGHALGLPDLYDTSTRGVSGNVGLGDWSLMATGGYGSDGSGPEYPAHLGAWPMLFLGWTTKVRPTLDSLITMGPIENGHPIIELWFQGESNSEHFLIENRRRLSFDRNLRGEGLLLYHVDDAAIGLGIPANRVIGGANRAMELIPADGQPDLINGLNRGDVRDPFPGGLGVTRIDDFTIPSLQTFAQEVTNLALKDITPIGDDTRFMAQVRAPGWLPAEDHSLGTYQPVASFGPATRAVRADDGTISWVGSETIGGRAQVVLRSKTGGVWDPPLVISSSPASAFDPTIAQLPGGDLAVVWSDTRHGARELYYRSRILGVWTTERRLTNLSGDSRSPSLAADPNGGLHLAWIYNDGGNPRLFFLYFTYYSPFGDPRELSVSGDRPDAPAIAAAPDGGSYIVWPDRRTGTPLLWYAHFRPDSGITAKHGVFESAGLPQTSPSALVDEGGGLHMIWQSVGPGGNEIHYQRRLPGGSFPDPRDDLIEVRGESLQDPTLSRDRQGGLHLALGAVRSGVLQVRYKLWQQGRGWDRVSTEVTLPTDGASSRPAVLASAAGDLSVLYTRLAGGQLSFMERQRELNPQTPTAVPFAVAPKAPSLRLAPNPIRIGSQVAISGVADAMMSTRLDVLDLAGRLVATSAVVPDGSVWTAHFSAEQTSRWRSGVYFVRLENGRGSARLVVLK
jgi:immune inhibitor A